MLISGRIVMVFAIFLGNGGSSLVEHTRQDRQAAKAHSRAARRTKSEIGGGNRSGHVDVQRSAFGVWRRSLTGDDFDYQLHICFRETFFSKIL
jgi:hypothetical protein